MRMYVSALSLVLIGVSAVGCASKEERQFISGCKTGGIEGSTCKCIYKKLEDKYGEDGFKNHLYTMSQTEQFQNDMVQSTMQCMRE